MKSDCFSSPTTFIPSKKLFKNFLSFRFQVLHLYFKIEFSAFYKFGKAYSKPGKL